MRPGEKFVEAVLGVVECVRRNRQSRAAETGRSHGDQQGRRRLAARGQIAEPLANQVSPWKRIDVHGTSNYTAEQVEEAQQAERAGPERASTHERR